MLLWPSQGTSPLVITMKSSFHLLTTTATLLQCCLNIPPLPCLEMTAIFKCGVKDLCWLSSSSLFADFVHLEETYTLI